MAERFEIVQKALVKMLEEKKYATLRDILITMNPSDVAGLFEDLEDKQIPLMFRLLTKEQAAEYAEELRKKVLDARIPFAASKVADVVTISQGMCWNVPKKGNRMWDYLHTADNMLYRVKKKQRNNYCVGCLKEKEEDIIISC